MDLKKATRIRRAMRTRRKISDIGSPRLSVFRSSQHIYAQLTSADGSTVLACASTLDKDFKKKGLKFGGNVEAAKVVGEIIAMRVLAKGIKQIAFDRSGFKYHGRVKALADTARENGLEF